MLCVRAVTKTISAQEPKVYKGCHGAERSLGRGSIVNLGSGLSYGAGPGMMAYVASKHAIMGITKVAGESFISPSKLEENCDCLILTSVQPWTMQNIKFE
jgi:NAD(P)-dependent dehydrogenase (short-subunit alcohol dehydrogenase family)